MERWVEVTREDGRKLLLNMARAVAIAPPGKEGLTLVWFDQADDATPFQIRETPEQLGVR